MTTISRKRRLVFAGLGFMAAGVCIVVSETVGDRAGWALVLALSSALLAPVAYQSLARRKRRHP